MSSTSGLSSNTSNNQAGSNPLKLDASTRESLQARNEARLLASLGIGKKDEFNSGGGLNPLKGLYSAAAATFLKNKQGHQTADQAGAKTSSLDSSVAAAKKLAASAASSGAALQNNNPNVSGPASGGNYKKYAWNGKPGPTGSDAVVETKPADPVAPSDGGDSTPAAVAPADDSTPADDAPKVTDPDPAPAAVTTPPVDQAAIDKAAADKAAADQAAADQAAADKAAADKAAADAAAKAAADAAAAKAASDAAAAKAAADAAAAAAAANASTPYANTTDLFTAFKSEITGLGGSVTTPRGSSTSNVSVRGMTGTVEKKSDEIRGQLSFLTGSVEFCVNLNGELTDFKTTGITLLKTADLAALKDSLSKLNKASVNVVA